MEYYLVFDTETVNENDKGFSMSGNQVFDLGFIVAEKTSGKVVEEYNKLVQEVFSNKELMAKSVFGKEYVQRYEDKVASGELEVVPAKVLAKEVREIVDKYNIEEIYAYNVNFDQRAITELGQNHDTGIIFDFDNSKVYDILHIACQALEGSQSYITFATDNNFVTEAGNVRSSAEAVYAYVKNDPNFIEEHTALSDALIENEILLWSLEREPFPGFFDKGPNPAAWRLVQAKKQ